MGKREKYKKCELCGAHLDYGESCDCSSDKPSLMDECIEIGTKIPIEQQRFIQNELEKMRKDKNIKYDKSS